jgi:fatty-acyl-CoA synthase
VALGDRVAILSRNSHAFAALRFALARLGAVLVPINFMLNADEVAYILRHAGAQTLIRRPRHAHPGTRRRRPRHPRHRSGCRARTGHSARRHDGLRAAVVGRRQRPAPALDSRMPAQIVYTSGTESLPKGAMLTHGAVIDQYVSCIIEGEMAEGDTVLHALPLYHCAQLDVFLGPAIYVGASSVITGKQTPDSILPLLARHRINSFFAPPSIWIALMRAPAFDTTDLSALRKGYYGASIMPVEVLKEIARRLPQVRLWNFYGQTEIAPLAED